MILPTDADYEAARVVMPGIIDRHPALIVRVATAADVAQAIELARENSLDLAVRSGGSAYPGATWNRLVAIKARYDPDNLFRLNSNIPPQAAR